MRPRYTVSQEHVRLSAASPVRCVSPRVQLRSTGAHDHDYFELFVVRDGAARHVTPDYDRTAGRGTVGILCPGEVHEFADCVDLRVTNVYYLAEWLIEELAGIADRDHLRVLFLEPALFSPPDGRVIPHVTLNADEFARLASDLDDLELESSADSPSHLFLRATLLKCMVRISRAYARGVESPPSRLRDEAWAVMIASERALATGSHPDLSAIAAGFAITRDHLCRLFRSSTGTSPTAYFARRRALAAASRLLEPATTVTDVALELGYADTAHLSRHFRRELGLSPRDYRNRYRAG